MVPEVVVPHASSQIITTRVEGAILLSSMKRKPSFFLTAAGEYEPLAELRECREVGRLRDARRDDYMLVEITPELPGQLFGFGDQDISLLILSTRHKGRTLYPISEWPSHVYVARILDERILRENAFGVDQVELIAKGTLYRARNDAS